MASTRHWNTQDAFLSLMTWHIFSDQVPTGCARLSSFQPQVIDPNENGASPCATVVHHPKDYKYEPHSDYLSIVRLHWCHVVSGSDDGSSRHAVVD